MAVEIATAYVSLVPSAKGIQGSIAKELAPVTTQAGKTGDQAGKAMQGRMNPALKGMATAAAGVFAVSHVKDFLSESVAEATESAKINAITANVIKTTGGAAKISASQVGDLATKISNYAGIDDEAVQAGANMLLTFTNVRNEAGKGNDIFNQATGIMTDLSVAMGTDVKGGAIQLGKALNDPIKGVGALSRVGVTFTKQQKDQIKTLVESGNTLGAQKIILGELSKEFGGTAKAAATPAEKLSVAWGNFKESIGTALLPLINQLAGAFQKMIPFLSANAGWLIKLAAGIAGLLVVGKLVGMIREAVTAFRALSLVFTASPIGLLIAAIALLVIGFIALWNKSEAFRNFWKGLWADIQAIASAVVDWIVGAWNALVTFFAALPGRVWAFLSGLWTGVITAATAVKDWIVAAWNAVVTFISGIPARIWGWLTGLWNLVIAAATAVKNWIVARWNDVIAFVSTIAGKVWSWLKNLWTNVIAAATAVKNWIVAAWNAVIAFLTGIPGRVWGAIKGMWNGVKGAAQTAVGWVKTAWNGLVGFFSGLGSRVFNAIAGFLRGIGNMIAGILQGLGLIAQQNATITPTARAALSANTPAAAAARARLAAKGIDWRSFGTGGVLPSGWSIVGDRGPELVHRSGGIARVVSNFGASGMTGGAPVTVNIIVNGPVVRSESDITGLTRAIGRDTNRGLRAAGIAVPISGATP